MQIRNKQNPLPWWGVPWSSLNVSVVPLLFPKLRAQEEKSPTQYENTQVPPHGSQLNASDIFINIITQGEKDFSCMI
jgi:hypothetical protein